jgi:hypothetical protein
VEDGVVILAGASTSEDQCDSADGSNLCGVAREDVIYEDGLHDSLYDDGRCVYQSSFHSAILSLPQIQTSTAAGKEA